MSGGFRIVSNTLVRVFKFNTYSSLVLAAVLRETKGVNVFCDYLVHMFVECLHCFHRTK